LVVGQLAAVLRMPPDRLVADRPFRSLGLDSLMGIELRNRLQRALGLKLSASTVWNFATINQLCAHLASRIEESSPSSTPHSVGTDARQSADRALEAELLQAEALLAEL
jgi:acyl carrier protein